MKLIKVSAISSLSVAVRVMVYFGINKIIAIYTGPSGYALLGQFQNISQIANTLLVSCFNTGVTKYTAEYATQPEKIKRLLGTVGTSALVLSIVSALLIFSYADGLSNLIFGSGDYSIVIYSYSLGLIFFVFNTIMLAVLNGLAKIKKLVLANIFGSLISFFIVCILTYEFNIKGALIAVAIYQAVAFFGTYFLFRGLCNLDFSELFGAVQFSEINKLIKFSVMAATTAIVVPFSQITIREYLIKVYGIDAAGYWEGMVRLSNGYLMLFTSVLSVYFLPLYSSTDDVDVIMKEMKNGYKLLIPVSIFFLFGVYTLRETIVGMAFANGFAPMIQLFKWYIVGDFIKLISWLAAFIFIGKSMVWVYLTTETVFSFTYVLFVILLTGRYGYEGVSYAHLVNHALYLITVSIILKFTFFKNCRMK